MKGQENAADGLLRAWAYWVLGDNEVSMGDNVLADMVDTSDRGHNPAYWKEKTVVIHGVGLIQSRANAIATYKASYNSITIATASRRHGGARVPLADKQKLGDNQPSRYFDLNQLLTSRMGHKSLKNVIILILNPHLSIREIGESIKIPPTTLQSQLTKARKLCVVIN